MNTSVIDATIIISISKLTVFIFTDNGLTRDANPRTIEKLATLEPIIFPILISALPFFIATSETTSSGKDVPNEIRNIPISHSLTPNSLAILVPLSITKLAPPIVRVKPMAKEVMFLTS